VLLTVQVAMALGDGTIVAIVFIIVGFAAVLVVISYRKLLLQNKKPTSVKRKAAFSLGGNFVEDLDVPIENKYEVTTNVLGSGSSAQVVIGENRKTKRKYAIKVIDLARHDVAWRYEREKNFLRDIDHTNVVRLYEVYSSPKALYFVMELCTGGHLGQVLRGSPEGRLDEKIALEYVIQLTRAIGHCHHHGICHRDVKLQNILLESSSKEAQIKLVDFGNGARFRNNLPLTKVVGTTYTAAPEVFRECYDERCDVWSLGVVTYILLSGRRPFEKMEVVTHKDGRPKREESVVASILMGRYNFDHEVWDEISNDAINFIRYCFVQDYTKRSSAAAMLEHPWLNYDEDFIPSERIRKLSFNSSDTLRKTLGRELSAPFSGIRHISMLAVAFARPTEKVQLLRKVFQEIDYNGSGMLELDEFLAAMKLMNPDLTSAQSNALFRRIDQDENHCISFIEFLAATLDPKDVDVNELKQAFHLIDRDNKGYISPADVYRILCTTNVQDLEYIQETTKATTGALSGSSGYGGITSINSPSGASAHSNNSAGVGGHGIHNVLSTSHRSTIAGDGSGRSTHSVEETIDLRNKKLEQRIEEIMEHADVNKDGVISIDEFMYAMSGGDVHKFRVIQENGKHMHIDLTKAPTIIQSHNSHDISFVATLKKKLSDGNVLFAGHDYLHGKSFPVRRKPSHESASKSWFKIPFSSYFHSTSTPSGGVIGSTNSNKPSSVRIVPVVPNNSSPNKDSLVSGSDNFKEVSIVSKFEEYEREVGNGNGSGIGRDQSRERRASDDPEAVSGIIQRLQSNSAHNSMSSKGPSWAEKKTPNTSFLVSGIMNGVATAGLLPNFTWSGKRPSGYEDLNIQEVIAKLEHSGQPGELHLRMNHDDPGVLNEHIHRPSAIIPESGDIETSSRVGGVARGGVVVTNRAGGEGNDLGVLGGDESSYALGLVSVEASSAAYSAPSGLYNIEDDIETGKR